MNSSTRNLPAILSLRIRSGKYIITTTTLRVKQFSNILCISSVFSPPAFLGSDPHFLWHSSPAGKAEGNSCTLHEVEPFQSQENIHHNETPSLLSDGFIRATVGVQHEECGRGWRGEYPLPCSLLYLPRVSRRLCKVSLRNRPQKGNRCMQESICEEY